MAKYTVEEIINFKEMGILTEEDAAKLIQAITVTEQDSSIPNAHSASVDYQPSEEHIDNEDVLFNKYTHIESYCNPLYSFVISGGYGFISSNNRSCGFNVDICGNNKMSRYLLRNKKICVLDAYKSSPG